MSLTNGSIVYVKTKFPVYSDVNGQTSFIGIRADKILSAKQYLHIQYNENFSKYNYSALGIKTNVDLKKRKATILVPNDAVYIMILNVRYSSNGRFSKL